MNSYQFILSTSQEGFYDITSKIRDAITESGIKDGICIVYCPHTTSAITINECYDSNVCSDILSSLNKTFPDLGDFKHEEGNSAAHIKSSIIGVSKTIIVENSKLMLGRWQGVFFCEFDGPRTRKFYVKIIPQ